MKLRLGMLLFAAMFALASFKSENAHAGKKSFDIWKTDQNGKKHHIHGWIEYTLFPPSIVHGDVWYDGDHIVWSAKVPNPSGIGDYDITIVSPNPELVPLEFIYSTMQEQIPPQEE